MSFSKGEVVGMKEPLRLYWTPKLANSSLIIGWGVAASTLGAKVTDYLIKKLGAESFGEIEPIDFFPLGGVSIEGDLIQFPESKFYASPQNNLLVFSSTPPSHDWNKFLNLILDAAQHHCRVREIYTIGEMVSLGAHTAPRELFGTFSSPEFKEALSYYQLARGLDYETPPGQRPTLNAFLLWSAKMRNIPGVNLWLPIPFYLIASGDAEAQKRALEFFNQRFSLGIDFADLDAEIRQQNQIMAELRDNSPDIDESIKRLEGNLSLSEEESQKLVKEVAEFLRERKG